MNKWCKKLAQITIIQEWKKNRNLYAILLLNMLINNRLEEPFDKVPKEDILPIISKTLVNSKLTPKFWNYTKQFINIEKVNLNYIYKMKDKQNNQILFNINLENNLNNNSNNEIENKIALKNSNIINNNEEDSYIDNLDNINLEDINLKGLKELAEILQKQLNDKEVIISYQKEEGIKLRERIAKLEEQISSFMKLDK